MFDPVSEGKYKALYLRFSHFVAPLPMKNERLQEKSFCDHDMNILEYPRYSNILDFLGITWRYWPLEYSRIFMKFQAQCLRLTVRLEFHGYI